MIFSTEDGDNFIYNRVTWKGCNSGTYGMQLEPVSETGNEPLSLDEVKEKLNIDYTDWDAVLSKLIRSARQRAEKFMNRSLRPQVFKVSWQHTSGFVELPYSPIGSIVSVVDKDGNTLAYKSDHQGRIDVPKGAIITYNAGDWGTLGVPESVKTGLIKDISSCFEYNENMIVGYSENPIGFNMEYYYEGHSKNLWL
ncbi:MAG TPA: head-tail connector protein [Verrucomicrobiae bacterium]|nr:head-tail connector protein [Verrucomicrobiae bacterium]